MLGSMQRGAVTRWLGRTVLATAALVMLVGAVSSVAATSRSTAYCDIPTVYNNPPWGFHTGQPISGPTGSYARGHGYFDPSKRSASGIMCQVDRPLNQPDRQIILSIDHHLIEYNHVAVKWGYPGNLVKLGVRVQKTTDPNCPVGTAGVVTIFASYNNVHDDSVKFSWPAACAGHRHLYHSQSVVTNVEPG
jgi:hypothetical protein